jgi:hypothetical protein
MVNIYDILINYKLISLQKDPWVRKKITEQRDILCVGAASTGTTGGEAYLAYFFFVLLVLLI